MRSAIRSLCLPALVALALAVAPAGAGAAGPPQVEDTWATAVTTGAGDLHGMVNPNGFFTSGRVEYLTEAAYQANLAAAPPRDGFSGATSSPVGTGSPLGAGSAAVELTRRVGGLQAATAYRYRVVATSSAATTLGPARLFVTQESTPGTALPDGRGWEMVSPVDKNGGEIQGPGAIFGGGVLQASADGSSVTYSSTSSFAGALGAPGGSQYISRRGGGAWATENVTQPTLAGAYGTHPDGVPYQLFSPDLARGLLVVPERCESPPCLRSYLLRQSANGSLAPSSQATDLAFAGSNPGLTQTVLSTQGNLYRWSGGGMTAVNLKPGDTAPTPGATLAAQSGAVSTDGSRIYFDLEGNLYLRDGSQTVQVDESVGGGGSFETASADGSVAFFTKAGHLYRYGALTKVATDLTPGGEVLGVLGSSGDGAYLYYLAAAGLFLNHSGSTFAVAAEADATNYPPTTGTARIAANGRLAFLSAAALTEQDTGGFAQVFLYAPAAQTLTCTSCPPSGTRPPGPATIPAATANGSGPGAAYLHKPRALSLAGNRLFFETRNALVASDTNSDLDVYQWEAGGAGDCVKPGGCVALISSGRATEGASFLDASADGSDAFFLTDGSLVPNDPGAVDVYDARVGGGFPGPQVPIACVADACQVVPGEPEDPAPSTAFYRPEGNPPLSYPKTKKKPKQAKKHKKTRKKKASIKRDGVKRDGKR
ncbi:MAG TPA: hypothetical protein VFX85_08900 [Solirubrobacterales bacterium]|nr:hypothetical protein [Solirubrobacterales bacterium]